MDINYWRCLEVNRGQREQRRTKGGCLGFLKGGSEGSGRGSLPRRGFPLDREARDDGETNGGKLAR